MPHPTPASLGVETADAGTPFARKKEMKSSVSERDLNTDNIVMMPSLPSYNIDMIYLDNAATGGFKPENVQNAVSAGLKLCANPGRSGHRLSVALAERVLACRNLLSELFGGYGFERVVFTKSCTEALNLALLGTLNAGDHVITTALEHNSVLRPLEHLARAGVITYSVVPLKDGRLDYDAFPSLVKENTRVAAVTSASNVTGETVDLKKVRSLLPERVLLFADGAQGAGHVRISMREAGVDALALAGHKGLHAMQGAGALLFSDRVNPRPLLFGGTGSESMNLGMPDYYPDRLESGTLSYPCIASLFEGALVVQAHREEHAERLYTLTETLLAWLAPLGAYRAYSKPNPCGIVSFAHATLPSEEVATRLSERYDIAVRGGLHCAPLVHRSLGTAPQGLVRASFSPFQSLREARALIRALREIS